MEMAGINKNNNYLLWKVLGSHCQIESGQNENQQCDFCPGLKETGLTCTATEDGFGFRKKRNSIISVMKTKTLICFAATAKLICAFVFAYAKC